MNDEEELLKTIILQHKDDTPRLVYADYLEEHGRAERAEFIRVQCRLNAIRPKVLSPFSAMVLDEDKNDAPQSVLHDFHKPGNGPYYMRLWFEGTRAEVGASEGEIVDLDLSLVGGDPYWSTIWKSVTVFGVLIHHVGDRYNFRDRHFTEMLVRKMPEDLFPLRGEMCDLRNREDALISVQSVRDAVCPPDCSPGRFTVGRGFASKFAGHPRDFFASTYNWFWHPDMDTFWNFDQTGKPVPGPLFPPHASPVRAVKLTQWPVWDYITAHGNQSNMPTQWVALRGSRVRHMTPSPGHPLVPLVEIIASCLNREFNPGVLKSPADAIKFELPDPNVNFPPGAGQDPDEEEDADDSDVATPIQPREREENDLPDWDSPILPREREEKT